MVTDAGAPYCRQPSCAPGNAAAMNCAVVCGTTVTGRVVVPAHSGRAGDTMYACETKVPAVVRSHWLVELTVPLAKSPTTAQARRTAVPVAKVPAAAAPADGAVRTFTLPEELRTVPIW